MPSIFNSVDFQSRMFCIVLDFEQTYKNVKKELGVFTDGRTQGYAFHISSSEKVQIHRASVLLYKKLARNCVEKWTVEI